MPERRRLLRATSFSRPPPFIGFCRLGVTPAISQLGKKDHAMDFAFSAEQESIRDAVSRICARFDDAFWLTHDREHRFPHEFYRAIADAGWLGIAMSEEVGGAGLGITEAALMMK